MIENATLVNAEQACMGLLSVHGVLKRAYVKTFGLFE
jgi:hypothetical protein